MMNTKITYQSLFAIVVVISSLAMVLLLPPRQAAAQAGQEGCSTVAACAQQAVAAAQAAENAASNALPLHTIIAWYQTSGNVPAGWAICDGTNGTPNLVGKFIQGVGSLGDVSPVPVGSATHHHSVNVSGRTGNAFGSTAYHVQQGGPPQSPGLDVTYAFSGSGQTSDELNIPPSIRIVFLMKIK